MDNKTLRFEAARVSMAMHKGQLYGDRDYFLAHVLPVATLVEELGGDDMDVAIAYLHDVLEDTDYSQAELRHVFGDEVWTSVIALSKIRGESYHDYMFSVLLNERACKVKKADTLRNLMQSMKEGNRPRIIKYTRQLAILNQVEIDLED